MYTQKEINDVLKIYDRLKSLRGTVRLRGILHAPNYESGFEKDASVKRNDFFPGQTQ